MKARYAIAGLVLTLITITFLTEYRSRTELDIAKAAISRGDFKMAIKHLTRSQTWYVPYGSSEKASAQLFNLGEELAQKGEIGLAMESFELMRGMLYGARSFYVPRMDLIIKAEPILAELRARDKLGDKASADQVKQLASKYLNSMRHPVPPKPLPAAAAAFGFLFWVFALVMFISVFVKSGETLSKRTVPFILLFILCYIVWLWGMKWA